MSRVKRFTPGPWDYHRAKHDDGRNNGSVIADAKSGRAGCVCKAPQYATDKQWVADAQLIAAAPDLLEALEELLSYTRSCEALLNVSEAGQCVKARAAIAKSYGEEA